MGQDFAQLQEWSEARELDWYLLENPDHKNVQTFFKELLHIYKKYPAMYQKDVGYEGFEWINANDSYRGIFSFIRKSNDGTNNLLFVINFTPMYYDDYRVGVPTNKKFKPILNSEDVKFGGSAKISTKAITPVKEECDGRPYSFAYGLAPYQVSVFLY